MITLTFQDRKVHLPTSWLDISYADAEKMGEITFESLVLYYFGIEAANVPPLQLIQLQGLLSFLSEPMPTYTHKGKQLLEESLYHWYCITRDFWLGIEKYEGVDVRTLPLVDVVSITTHYNQQLSMIDKVFSELKEDLRTEIERKSQPNGFWDAVQDEILFNQIGCPLNEDPFDYMKTILLWRYFSSRLLSHKTAKSAKRQQELRSIEN